MITGTAVAQETIEIFESTPYASITWAFDGDDRNLHVRLSNGSSVIWHQDGKAYKLVPTKSMVTMPFKECGRSHQIILAKPIFLLEEVAE